MLCQTLQQRGSQVALAGEACGAALRDAVRLVVLPAGCVGVGVRLNPPQVKLVGVHVKVHVKALGAPAQQHLASCGCKTWVHKAGIAEPQRSAVGAALHQCAAWWLLLSWGCNG